MDLYIVRHGIAVRRDSQVPDSQRPLTAEGAKRFAQVSRGLRRLGVRLTGIWTSPLVRARQTAEILAEEFSLTASVREEAALQPDTDPAALVEPLSGIPAASHLAVVGHDPHLGRLATYLLTGLTTGVISIKKGGVARITITSFDAPVRGELRWLLTPRQVRRIK